MLKRVTVLVGAFFLLGAALASGAGPYDKYLSVAGLERIAGLQGVQRVAQNPSRGAGGDLNFANVKGQMILMVQFLDRAYYSDMKRAYFKADLNGVGEKGFKGCSLPSGPWNIVAFTKGIYCVVMTTYWNPSHFDETMLNMDQMIALARVIAARL